MDLRHRTETPTDRWKGWIMSDEHFYESTNKETRLRVWAFGEMARGAGMAAAALALIGAVLVAIWGVGLLLPEESKQAPAPYGALEIQAPIRAIA
jgi:hypothetical protein